MRQNRTIAIHTFVELGMVSICLTLFLPTQASAATLQQQLEQAITTFGNGDYTSSYWQFESMELDYGTEPEFLARNFQQTILPVRGYAALMADRPTDALIYFGELLSQYQPHPSLQGFALYNAAIAQSQTNALAAAAQTFHNFQLIFPGSNEAALALLQEADLRYDIGEVATAIALLEAFYESEAPETLRMQARLRALQIASETDSTDRAREILFESDWNIDAMPDIAVLSFAALDAGDRLLNAGHYSDAVRAYRLTLPRKVLIDKQSERLERVKSALAQQSLFASSIWKSHSQQLVARLTRQLELLEYMSDYTPGLYLRSGQAYLLGLRYREAIILFRTVAQTPEFESDTRAEAHYRWILSLSEAEDWQGARDTAQLFLNQHPGHKLANSALFLIARAYQSEGQFLEAIAVLDDLITNYPNDKQAPRWYFTRGYNLSALERQSTARDNFETALERFPESILVEQLKLWRGLTFFFERDYTASLYALEALKKSSKKHPLYPEINYRIANVTYAQRDYDAALKTADTLIKSFPDHHRVPEAQTLRGDIFMGQGELLHAANAFRQVPPDDAQLYDYAIFQVLENLQGARTLRPTAQTSASLHRPGRSQRTNARERSALLDRLVAATRRNAAPKHSRYLNKPSLVSATIPTARAVGSILSAYAELYKASRQHRQQPALDFDTWLQKRHRAKPSPRPAHLVCAPHTVQIQPPTSQPRRRTRPTPPCSRFTVLYRSTNKTPKHSPASASCSMQRGYGSADDYCEQILTEYPKRFERASAYFGKAQLAANAERLTEARRWLLRFLEETPTHPLAADVRLLSADMLTQQGIYDGAREVLNEILQIKAMRGRPHARALAGLARIETDAGQPRTSDPLLATDLHPLPRLPRDHHRCLLAERPTVRADRRQHRRTQHPA